MDQRSCERGDVSCYPTARAARRIAGSVVAWKPTTGIGAVKAADFEDRSGRGACSDPDRTAGELVGFEADHAAGGRTCERRQGCGLGTLGYADRCKGNGRGGSIGDRV